MKQQTLWQARYLASPSWRSRGAVAPRRAVVPPPPPPSAEHPPHRPPRAALSSIRWGLVLFRVLRPPSSPRAQKCFDGPGNSKVWLLERHGLAAGHRRGGRSLRQRSRAGRTRQGLAFATADMLDEGAGELDALAFLQATSDLGARSRRTPIATRASSPSRCSRPSSTRRSRSWPTPSLARGTRRKSGHAFRALDERAEKSRATSQKKSRGW